MQINATLLGEIITFVVFVLITMKYIWPPITKAMQERSKKIADGLEAGQRGEQSLKLAQEKSTSTIAKAKEEASSIVNKAAVQSSQIIDQGKVQAQIQVKSIMEKANADIKLQIENSKELLKKEITDIVILGAEKILKQKIDKAAHDKMINELINELA